MRKYFFYILLCSFGCDNKQHQKIDEKTEGLIEVSNKDKSTIVIEDIYIPEIKMMEYLTSHFIKNQDTIFVKKPEWMIYENTTNFNCGFIISFEEGHTFKHEQECNEWGEIITVSFKGYSIAQVREVVELLFKTEGYDWYKNNTEYRPEKYYETIWTFRIIESEKSIELEFAYSWI